MDPGAAGDVVGSGRPTLRRIAVKKEKQRQRQEQEEEQEQGIRQVEPVTPAGRVFSQPSFNCYIVVIFRLKTAINVEGMRTGLENSLIKHKRFSSIMKKNKDGTLIWVPTKVNISDHVIVPLIDGADNNSPGFVEKYAADLASAPALDPCRPLWQMHLLNVESEDAESSAVMRIHHSLGDGVSLMSLLLACTRKAGDPDSLPTIPRQSRPTRIGRSNDRKFPWFLGALLGFLLVIWYTLVDVLYFVATLLWIKDSDTPIKGFPGVESSPKQIVYKTFSLEDVKFVKKAINGTINDVLLGITSAGIVRYLQRKYDEKRSGNFEAEAEAEAKQTEIHGKGGLPSNLRVRSTILVNTRPSPGLQELAELMESGKKARWGNNLGYMIVNLPMVKHENPLDYVRAAAVMARRKKQSLEAPFTYASGTLLLRLTNVEVATRMTYNLISNTTFSFSNIVGPVEEVEIFSHPIVHIIPTVVGHPQALTMHFQSYMGKMTLVVSAATDVIPDPKQLCLDCLDAFHSMKQALQ
uniref:Uncharacterized protein n=1 Tax=Araucaria cunninghamii TaxID=56994 RepID=A0A0D6R6X2_ARACU